MAGHFNLGDYFDMPLGRVCNDLTNLILRVVSAVPNRVELLGAVRADHRSVSPCADLRQLRILLYLDPPPLILRQMPVEFIHLVHREIKKYPKLTEIGAWRNGSM